ncbi:MAG: Pyrroline-5-carboxylate reductase, partial [uncultured Nocardioidaceae bacterium]
GRTGRHPRRRRDGGDPPVRTDPRRPVRRQPAGRGETVRARHRAHRAVRRDGARQPRRNAQGRHRRGRRQAPGHERAARRDRPRPASRPASGVARRRHHHRVHRDPDPRGRRGGARHAEHAGPRRRGDGGDLPRFALRRRAPRRGGVPDGLDRSCRPGPRAPAGRDHRDQRLGAGVHLLRGRVDDRGRCAPRAAPHHRHRARRPDRGRLGEAAARDRRAPDRAPRAGHLARRHHRGRGAPARGPQGACRLPHRDGGRAGPVAGAGRGRPM